MGKFFKHKDGSTDWGKVSLTTQLAGPVLGMTAAIGLIGLGAYQLRNYVPSPLYKTMPMLDDTLKMIV